MRRRISSSDRDVFGYRFFFAEDFRLVDFLLAVDFLAVDFFADDLRFAGMAHLLSRLVMTPCASGVDVPARSCRPTLHTVRRDGARS
jgi:hypothetical protein